MSIGRKVGPVFVSGNLTSSRGQGKDLQLCSCKKVTEKESKFLDVMRTIREELDVLLTGTRGRSSNTFLKDCTRI